MIDLKKIRTEKGLTQDALSNKCGVQRTTITMIESGENKPSVDLAKKIAEVLEIKWTDFFED